MRVVASVTASLVMLLAGHAGAVLFGADARGPGWSAVVSLNGGACTATFIHPRFVITAAHCIRQCTSAADVGCVTGAPRQVGQGNWVGRDGPPGAVTATSGDVAGQGDIYRFDFIHFPVPADLGRSTRPDIAVLRSTDRFNGQVIPMLPGQDLPRPDEGNYCARREYSWPTLVGFSPNSGVATMARRFGRAFAECDLELWKALNR